MTLKTMHLAAPTPMYRFTTYGTVATSTSGNLTLALPTGWKPGMLAIAMISYRGTNTFSAPTGWQNPTFQDANGSNTTANATTSRGAIFVSHRVLVAGDGDPTFTRTAATAIALGQIICYVPGFDAVPSVISTSGWDATAAGTVFTLKGITPASNGGDILLCVAALSRNGTPNTASWDVNSETLTTFAGDTTTAGADCALWPADYVSAGSEVAADGDGTGAPNSWHKTVTLLLRQR